MLRHRSPFELLGGGALDANLQEILKHRDRGIGGR